MNDIITVDQALWGLLVAQVLPIVVGLVTDRLASGGFKALVLLALSAVTVVAEEILAAGEFEPKAALLKWAALFGASVISYKGWQEPAKVTGRHSALAAKGLSLGSPS